MAKKTKLVHLLPSGKVATRTTARDYKYVVIADGHVNNLKTREQIEAFERKITEQNREWYKREKGLTDEEIETMYEEAVEKEVEYRAKEKAGHGDGTYCLAWSGTKVNAEKTARKETGYGFINVRVEEINGGER